MKTIINYNLVKFIVAHPIQCFYNKKERVCNLEEQAGDENMSEHVISVQGVVTCPVLVIQIKPPVQCIRKDFPLNLLALLAVQLLNISRN